MKRTLTFIALATLLVASMSSCTSTNKMMREPNVRVELERNNFELSDQVSAKASQTKIVGIDFQRLFNKETGEINKGGSAAGGINVFDVSYDIVESSKPLRLNPALEVAEPGICRSHHGVDRSRTAARRRRMGSGGRIDRSGRRLCTAAGSAGIARCDRFVAGTPY